MLKKVHTYDLTPIEFPVTPVRLAWIEPGILVKSVRDERALGLVVSVDYNTLIVQVLWSVAPADRIKMPLPRRVFPSMVAKDLISIQPMTTSNTLLFYHDYKYGQC